MLEENVAAMWRIADGYDRNDRRLVLAERDPELEIDDADIPEATGEDSAQALKAAGPA
jgi:hypothetical protein